MSSSGHAVIAFMTLSLTLCATAMYDSLCVIHRYQDKNLRYSGCVALVEL